MREVRSLLSRLRGVSCLSTSRHNNAELFARCDVFGLSGRVVEESKTT